MLVVFDSMTGNVKRFVTKLGMQSVQITSDLIVDEPYVLVTYTSGFGEIPKSTDRFLQDNYKHMIAVAASGNRNWGHSFAKSADIISERYGVPIIHKFELSGVNTDIDIFKREVKSIAEQRTKVG